MKINDENYKKFPENELNNNDVSLQTDNDDDDLMWSLMLEQRDQMGAGF